jgi:Secretion system C-terminal sorting domain
MLTRIILVFFVYASCVYSQNNWKIFYSENQFRDVEVDEENNIWVASLRGNEGIKGLLKFDGDQWTTFLYPQQIQYVNDIEIDNSNNIWVAHKGGVISFNGIEWGSTISDTLYDFQETFASKLFVDVDNNLWMSNRWYYLILYANDKKEVFDFREILSAENCWVYGTESDSQGNLFVFVRTKKNTSYHISYYTLKYTNQIWEIVCVIDENMWEGLFSDFNGLHIDNQNNIWLSTYDNLVMWNGSYFEIFEIDIPTLPNDIESDSEGNIWIGTTNDGIIKFDREQYFHYNSETTNYPNKNILEINFNKTGKLWVVLKNYGFLSLEEESLPTNISTNENYFVQFDLSQNYPNPFNPTTTIRYTIHEAGRVQIKVYNLLGSEVNSLLDTYRQAGTHEVRFDSQNLASGIYYYKIITKNHTKINKMTLLK